MPSKANLELYKQIFGAIDSDKSGKIDVKELTKALKELGIDMDFETIKGMIELVDANNDGQMDIDEFSQFLHICENAKPDDIRTILFLAADTNYSNTIDRAELGVIFKKLGVNASPKEIDEVFGAVADNKDNTISYEMFLAMVDELMK